MIIKKYNLGFGLFGPLEQSTSGKFVLSKDVDKLIEQIGILTHEVETSKKWALYSIEALNESKARTATLEKTLRFSEEECEDCRSALMNAEIKEAKTASELKFCLALTTVSLIAALIVLIAALSTK